MRGEYVKVKGEKKYCKDSGIKKKERDNTKNT